MLQANHNLTVAGTPRVTGSFSLFLNAIVTLSTIVFVTYDSSISLQSSCFTIGYYSKYYQLLVLILFNALCKPCDQSILKPIFALQYVSLFLMVIIPKQNNYAERSIKVELNGPTRTSEMKFETMLVRFATLLHSVPSPYYKLPGIRELVGVGRSTFFP